MGLMRRRERWTARLPCHEGHEWPSNDIQLGLGARSVSLASFLDMLVFPLHNTDDIQQLGPKRYEACL